MCKPLAAAADVLTTKSPGAVQGQKSQGGVASIPAGRVGAPIPGVQAARGKNTTKENTTAPAPAPAPRRDCQVGKWKATSKCSKPCGGGVQNWERPILQVGASCPKTSRVMDCNTHSCSLTPLKGGNIMAWPMERKSIANAYDNDITTWTYTTAAWCEHSPFYVAISFPRYTLVSGLRLWKRHVAGKRKDCGTNNLAFLYGSERPGTPMEQRDLQMVRGLNSGFEGRGKWRAESVQTNGFIVRDVHDSDSAGWASVSFDTVNVTAIAMQVDSPEPHYNHLCLGEIQAWQDRDASLLTQQLGRETGV